MDTLSSQITGDVGIIVAVILAFLVGWRLVTIELAKLWAASNRLHRTVADTSSAVASEKDRNSHIELKATVAAEKVGAIAAQVDSNKSELQLIRILVAEWEEDRTSIAQLREELRADRKTISELTEQLHFYRIKYHETETQPPQLPARTPRTPRQLSDDQPPDRR